MSTAGTSAQADLSFEATSRVIETPRGPLHYHEAGDGPPLLLLHGSGPGVSGWANYAGNLAAFSRSFRTLVLDFPGFGRSYATEGSPMMAALPAAVDFLDALELDGLPVVGNSMGGSIAARLAATHPERVSRLVTIGGIGVPIFNTAPSEGLKLLVEFVEEPTRKRLEAWMESMVYDPAILTEDFVEMRWQAATNPAALADVRRMFNRQSLVHMRNRTAQAADQMALLPNIQAPTLVTFGRDDRVTPLDSALLPMRLIPKCELHVFHDCGHWAMIERKNEFESVVLSFLERDLNSPE